MKRKLKEDFNSLKEKDIFSILLFILYNLRVIPKYKNLTDLIFILDKKQFLKLCQYYGGRTITLPTTEELADALAVLQLYQMIKLEHVPSDVACEKFDQHTVDEYKIVEQILSEYEFR